MNFSHCLHIVSITGKYTDNFRGDFFGGAGGLGERVMWEYLSMEEFFMAEENFHEGGST